MIKFTKLHDLAAYLKQAAGTYLQYDYEFLYQELRARYEQQVMEAFWVASLLNDQFRYKYI